MLSLSKLVLLSIGIGVLCGGPAPAEAIVLTPDEGKCRVLGFFPTEIQAPAEGELLQDLLPDYARWTREETRRISHSNMATAYLAMKHFHNRDTSVVPELKDLPTECTVELDLKINTEHLTEKRAGQIMVEQAEGLCAFLGTYDPDVARAMQPTSAALDLPQVIYYTLDQFLTSSKRPSAIGLPPTVLPHTRGLAEYLNSGQVEPPREVLMLVYEEAYTSSYFSQCFGEDAAEKFGMESYKYQDDHFGIIPTVTAEVLQRRVLTTIKDSGVKTIFLNKIDAHGLAMTADILADLDMLTDEYVYIFQPQAVPTDAVGTIFGGQSIDSPLDRLLRGGIILDHHDLYRANGDQDPFLKMWKSQGPEILDEIRALYPDFDEYDEDYFQTTLPADYSSFLYDAIISIGNGACYATTEKPETDTKPFRNDIQAYNFTGATGPIHWGAPDRSCKYKSNRCNDPVKFGIFNIQAVPISDGIGSTLHTYKAVLTAEWDEQNRWQKKQDFVYRDGTTIQPTELREAKEENHLSSGTRNFGYALFGISAGLSLFGLIALLYFRKDSTVVRSQPFFMALLCLGSLLMSVAIITLSFDETTASSPGLDVACMSTMWFFFLGHVLSFSALFTKLWRLNSVLQFKRGTTFSRNKALIPVLLLVGITVVILLTWTLVDPWTWNREWVSYIPSETYSECKSDNFWSFFGPLTAILVLAEALTLWFVTQTWDVNQDYSDTKPCIYAMLSQFQAWLVGVPILLVLDTESVDAVYMSRALLICIFSVSGVCFVIGPRIYRAIYLRCHPEEAARARRVSAVHVSGLNDHAMYGSSGAISAVVGGGSGSSEIGSGGGSQLRAPSPCPSRVLQVGVDADPISSLATHPSSTRTESVEKRQSFSHEETSSDKGSSSPLEESEKDDAIVDVESDDSDLEESEEIILPLSSAD